MKILYLLQDFPYPPTAGMRWKTYNLLSYMSRRHECHVLSFRDSSSTQEEDDWIKSLPGLRVLGVFALPKGWGLKKQQAKNVILGNPPSLARWESPLFSAAIRQVAKRNVYDVAHFDMINMAQYRPLLCDVPGVLSTNDAMEMRYKSIARTSSNFLRRMSSYYKASRFAAYETSALLNFAALHVVSQVDADFLIAGNPCVNNVEVISLCVDPSFLEILPSNADSADIRGRKVILFTSGFFGAPYIAEPIRQFAKGGFQKIRSIWPNVEFFVIGRDSPVKVSRILAAEPGVRFVTWVEDYLGSLAKSDIAVFLDKSGSGIKTRVIQALAAGKPVVGTPVVFEGIKIEDGINAFQCATIDDVTDRVLQLLQNPALRYNSGRLARELIRQHYTESVIGPQWELLYDRAIRRFRQQRPSISLQ